jgi:hypothetical protein
LSATVPIADALVGGKKTFAWVDALIGLRFRAPLGSRAGLIGRGDIAGGGSKFTWNLESDLAYGLSEHWTLGAGWAAPLDRLRQGHGRGPHALRRGL